MKRFTVFAGGALAALALVFTSSPAAADGFTLDPPGVDGQIATHGESAMFTGTLVPEETSGIFAFVDEKLVTCDTYFGNEINSREGCWRIATIEGSRWRFTITLEELDRLGLTFLGPHEVRFVLTHSPTFDREIVAESTVRVAFVDTVPTPSAEALPAPVATESPISPASTSGIATGDPSAPSVLSALRTVSDGVTAPSNLFAAAAVTIILLLLVGLPSALLGQSLGENYDRLFGRVTAAVRRATTMEHRPSLPGWLPITFGLVLATIMSAFVDPGFGFNPGSVRMLASMGIAFALESVAGWVVIRAVLARTDPDLNPKPEFKFGSLLIILIAVILSRIVGFEPGMVFGLVVGLAYGVSLASAREVRVKLIGLAWAFAIGVVGWVGYSLLAGVSGWLPLFAAETLSAVAVSSLAALPVALLPLGGLDGGVLFRWNRWAWAGVYAVALFVFFFVLMPMPFSWGEIGTPLATWVGLYLAYAVFAVAVWAGFRFSKPKLSDPRSGDLEAAA